MAGLDRRHYQLLLALGREGSITAASAALGITQSAASQRLQEAERRLGIALFERRGRALIPLPTAERLAAAAEASERLTRTAEADAQWLSRATGMRVRVLVSVFDTAGWILALEDALKRAGHAATLELVRATPASANAMLRAGEAELMLSANWKPVGDLVARPILTDDLVGVAPPDDPEVRDLPASDALPTDLFGRRPYITYSYLPAEGFEYDQVFSPADVMPETVHRVESVRVILDMVAQGRGFSILSRWTTHEAARAGRVAVRSLARSPRIDWSMVTRRLDNDTALSDLVARIGDRLPGLLTDPPHF
jgi:LysR family transcriptional regulator for metE and metH